MGSSELLVVGVLAGWLYKGAARALSNSPSIASVPTTTIKRGDLTFTVTARGELQGGNSEMLSAPMVAGTDMAITFLRMPGEMVKEGDVVTFGAVSFAIVTAPKAQRVD